MPDGGWRGQVTEDVEDHAIDEGLTLSQFGLQNWEAWNADYHDAYGPFLLAAKRVAFEFGSMEAMDTPGEMALSFQLFTEEGYNVVRVRLYDEAVWTHVGPNQDVVDFLRKVKGLE
jgi:hypothetical protein